MSYIRRFLKAKLLRSLNTNPILFLNGARQVGKSTLVQALSKTEFPAEYVTFDSATQMAAAGSAPEAYLRNREGALIIDEVQLVPEIFRALKLVVDERRLEEKENTGGPLKSQFLLTGSANIMALPKLSNPLVGRMNVLTLYPLSGAEVLEGQGDFVECLFQKEFLSGTIQKKSTLNEVLHKATYPEISNVSMEERRNWFDGYLTTILQRDVRALAEIDKLSTLPNLLRILAARAGGLVNDASIARDAGLNAVTSRNYKTLLTMLFLTFEVPPWYRNVGKRLVKSPKGYLVDTLLLCHLLEYDLTTLEQNKPELFGHVLENFVASELLKLLSFQSQPISLYHFRSSDNKEVDFVLERANGKLVGIEVKTKDNVNASDFKGLKELQRLVESDFVCGVVLYRGKDVVPFGENLWAVPVDNLWR
jgi:predicted AAA+ superfamily ATPase